MKEKIVIEGKEPKEVIRKLVKASGLQLFENLQNKNKISICGEELRVEQVPETWEELKELVREKVYDDDRNGVKIGQCVKVEYILIDGKSFMPDGEILDEDNDVFAVNRTPEQMWEIIKNLIGEK